VTCAIYTGFLQRALVIGKQNRYLELLTILMTRKRCRPFHLSNGLK
jgi:hypothetical protein